MPVPLVKVLSVASEAYPLVKTGGLADVVGALPAALGFPVAKRFHQELFAMR